MHPLVELSKQFGIIVLLCNTLYSFSGKTFQNRKVSSPAPVTIVDPSGLIERYNTLI